MDNNDIKKVVMIRELFKLAYAAGGREWLLEAINDPDQAWDDVAMATLDLLLGYK